MIFQSYALWPHMTAFQNVAYPLQSRRLKKKEIAERVGRVFELVGIPELQRQYPGQMSGGQQQRVALARALAGDADLILFDEPLSNVDAKVREQLRFELLSMQRELGFAAIYVTHDQAEAMELAHRSPSCARGRSRSRARRRRSTSSRASRYVADFVGSSNELVGTLRSRRRRRGRRRDRPRRVSGVAADGIASGDRVVAICRPERTRLAREEPQSPNRWRAEVRASAFLGAEPRARRARRRAHLPALERRHEPARRGNRGLAVRRAGARPGAAGDERLRPARAGDVRQLPRGVRRAAAALPRRAQRRLQRVLGAHALRRRRRRRERPGHVHDDGAERRPEARVHRPAAAAPPRPAGPHAVPRGAEPLLHAGEDGAARAGAARDHRRPARSRSSTPAAATSARSSRYRLPGYVFAEFFNLTPELGLRIREASREFNVAVQDFVEEDVKRTSMQLYDIAREIIEMRKAEPLDPADDPATRPARDRPARRTCCSGRSGSSSSSG